MVTILIEERLAFVVYQPKAFEKGIVPAGSLGALSSDAAESEAPSGRRAK
jgi:hypothetical protein